MSLSCRLCLLKVEPTNSKSIFSKSETGELISDMVKAFAAVELREDDDLPQEICVYCLQKLHEVFEFKKLILGSDLHLKELVKVQNGKKAFIVVKEEKQEVEDDPVCNQDVALQKNEVCLKNEVWVESSGNAYLNKLLQQSKYVHKPRTYFCSECNESFRSEYSYTVHKFSHTGAMPFICEFCSKIFPTRYTFNIHKRKHSEIRPFKCKTCEKSFKFPSNLVNHQKLHQGLKPHQCNTCGKTFSTKGELQAHENIHTKEKQYICEICSKVFHSQSNFSNHLKRHQKLTVLCPLCGKSYPSRGLAQHLKTHTQVRNYKCEICQRSLTTNTALKIHMRIHDDVKPYTCEICGKSFRQSSVLTKHRRVHTGETPFPCMFCEREFAYKHHLKKHLQKEHPQADAETAKN